MAGEDNNYVTESLIGKTVRITNKDLLQIFYPNFIVKDNLFFDRGNDVIYVGGHRKDLISYLQTGTRSFINTVGVYDIDLDIRETLVRFVYNKHKKTVKEHVIDAVQNMSEDDFYNFVKIYWVSGVSDMDDDPEATIFDLYKNLGKSRAEVLKVYHRVRKTSNAVMVQNSLLTFIEKSLDVDNVSGNARYLKLLREFRDNFGIRIKGILFKYYTSDEDIESKLLKLVMKLGK